MLPTSDPNQKEKTMRIIKLSSDDPDMRDRNMVDFFFNEKLHRRIPPGKFLLTKGRIAEDGILPEEMLIFLYKGEIVYLALSSSGRLNNTCKNAVAYPYYFCVDIKTITRGAGDKTQLDVLINSKVANPKDIVRARGWPSFKDSPELKKIWEHFKAK